MPINLVLAVVFGLLFLGDIVYTSRGQYEEDELGSVTLFIHDAAGLPAEYVQVYYGDNVGYHQQVGETDANGRIEINNLFADKNLGYYFFTFIDGYVVERFIEHIDAGEVTYVEMGPNSVNNQNISIEATWTNSSLYGNLLFYTVNISNCTSGDVSFVDILAYDDNDVMITEKCDWSTNFGFNYSRYARLFPWLGYGYDLSELTYEEKNVLEEQTGELCLGDLEDIGGECAYPEYNDPMKQRIMNGYKQECPQGWLTRANDNKIYYIGHAALPDNSKRVSIRAVGIDKDGDYKTIEKTLIRDPIAEKQEWPCWPCIILAGILCAIAGFSLITGSLSIIVLSKVKPK